jgi:hypothetical protein
LRWKRHAGWDEIINGMQKAILDVSTLAANHPIFVNHQIKSVHQPLDSSSSSSNSGGSSKQVCRRMSLAPDVDAVRLFPLTINHYVGSRERYLSRKDVQRGRWMDSRMAGKLCGATWYGNDHPGTWRLHRHVLLCYAAMTD